MSICNFDNRSHEGGNKLRTYRLFKNDIALEPYLTLIKERSMRQNFTKLRISSHTLAIETGRHRRHAQGNLPVNERKCDICTDSIEDEKHRKTNNVREIS